VRTSRAYRLMEAHLRDARTLVRPPTAFRTFPPVFLPWRSITFS
jgi:hypothetical protein